MKRRARTQFTSGLKVCANGAVEKGTPFIIARTDLLADGGHSTTLSTSAGMAPEVAMAGLLTTLTELAWKVITFQLGIPSQPQSFFTELGG